MLIITDIPYYKCVIDFSKKVKKHTEFSDKLSYLNTYGCVSSNEETKCILYKDNSPYSFYFEMFKKIENEYLFRFNGGLILHNLPLDYEDKTEIVDNLYWGVHT